jgi:hypothetical protein
MEAGKVRLAGVAMQAPEMRKLDLIDAMVMAADSRVSDATLAEVERAACPTCGSCSGMFTANYDELSDGGARAVAPGERHNARHTRRRRQLFRRAGRLIVELTRRYYEGGDERVLPRAGGFKAFENAMTLDIAMGGSTNTILHILAVAQEAGVAFTLKDIDRLSRGVPQLVQGRAEHQSVPHRGRTTGGRNHGDSWRTGARRKAPHGRPKLCMQRRWVRHLRPGTFFGPRTTPCERFTAPLRGACRHRLRSASPRAGPRWTLIAALAVSVQSSTASRRMVVSLSCAATSLRKVAW